MQRQIGLTLLELMVVLVIIGFVTAGVALALRDSRATVLEREGQRLVAKLEAARTLSRTSGLTMVWRANDSGFAIETWPMTTQKTTTQEAWLQQGLRVDVEQANTHNIHGALVVLGPEPILSPTRIVLQLTPQPNASSDAKPTPRLRIGTDGVRPFEVLP